MERVGAAVGAERTLQGWLQPSPGRKPSGGEKPLGGHGSGEGVVSDCLPLK